RDNFSTASLSLGKKSKSLLPYDSSLCQPLHKFISPFTVYKICLSLSLGTMSHASLYLLQTKSSLFQKSFASLFRLYPLCILSVLKTFFVSIPASVDIDAHPTPVV